jgi:hypothetical protein
MKSTKTIQSYKNTAAETDRSTLKNTKSGFFDPDRIKEQNKKDQPKDGLRSPWDFRCPQYDQRSSNFVNAGTHYGIAMKQPIGHKGNPKKTVLSLPTSRVDTQQVDDLG